MASTSLPPMETKGTRGGEGRAHAPLTLQPKRSGEKRHQLVQPPPKMKRHEVPIVHALRSEQRKAVNPANAAAACDGPDHGLHHQRPAGKAGEAEAGFHPASHMNGGPSLKLKLKQNKVKCEGNTSHPLQEPTALQREDSRQQADKPEWNSRPSASTQTCQLHPQNLGADLELSSEY